MMKENLQKNFFRYKKIKGHFFLTTDFGTWCILNKSEFEFFNSKPLKALDKKLLKKLKSALIIINKKDLNRITDLYFNKYKAIYNGPTLFVIFITNKCNFKCKYCFASANITKNVPNKINNNELANLIKIITFILNTPQKNINIEFQGGEPLLKFELIKKAIFQAKKMNNKFKKNIKFSITTNFSLLTDEIIDYLNKENIQISGSLDGEKDLHNANRIFADGKGTYDLVNNKIQYLTTKLLKKFSLLSVVTKNSLGKEKEIVDTIIKNNRKIVILNQIRYTGRAIKGNNWSDIGITDDEYLVFWKKLINYIFKLNQKGIFITERYFDIALAKLFSSSEPNFLDWRSPCGAIIGQITFDIDGNIYPCHEANNNKELILAQLYPLQAF